MSIRTMPQQVAKNTIDIEELQGKALTDETSINELESNVTQLQSNVTQAQGDISQVQEDLVTLQLRVTNNETAISTAQGDINSQGLQIDVLSTNIENAQQDITDLQGDVGALQMLKASYSKVITIQVSAWNTSSKSYVLTIAALETNDTILVSPSSRADQTIWSDSEIFVTALNGVVTFSYENLPTSSINIDLTLLKGGVLA